MQQNNTTNPQEAIEISIIRMKKLQELTGISRTGIWRKLNDEDESDFPTPVRIGPHSIGWYRHEVEQYILSLPRITTNDRRR